MPLTAFTVSKHLTDYDQIKDLYQNIFPDDELVKWSWLLRKSRSKNAEFLAYYDANQFVGFSYMIHQPALDFLFYLAVDPEQHSQGYGGQILDWLNATHPKVPIVLEIEPLDEHVDNAEQRQRRLAFYQNHGFHRTDHQTNEDGTEYDILTNGQDVDFQQLAKAYHWFYRPFNHRHHVDIHQVSNS